MNRSSRLLLVVIALAVCLAGPLPWQAALGGRQGSAAAQGLKVHPVILVHGLGGHADNWKAGNGTIWDTLQQYGYDMDYVLAFAYPPGPDGEEDTHGDVRLIADELDKQADLLSQRSLQAGGPGEVDVVAHSLGGLVTRQYLATNLGDHKVGKFIDLGTPHSGSELMRAYNDTRDGLADDLSPAPVTDWLARKAIDLLVHAAWERYDLYRYSPNPTRPASQQIDPRSDFIRELNKPSLSPSDVDYSMLYGDIALRLRVDFFGLPITSELLSVGDLVVGRENACTIPGVGSRLGPNPRYYHTYGFDAPITLQVTLNLSSPEISLPNLEEGIRQAGQVNHLSLTKNPAISRRILEILNGQPGGGPPSPPPPGGPAATATVLLLDVSGSMGEGWQGGVKIESAREAALQVVDMVEQDSQAGGVQHQVAVASFSSDGWLNLPLTNDYAQARQTIEGLGPQGNTNMGAGLQQANAALSGSAAKKIVILLSDGLTNAGIPPDEILSGPVQEAAQAGTCIYTVGFGDPGALDEGLLQRIAQAACGQYTYARTPFDLAKVYIGVRHRSTGTVIAEYSGQVEQGETTVAQPVQVPSGQGEMHATLNWPGSRLDMVLTDPRGIAVDGNYPGATLTAGARMVYLIVTKPRPGVWQSAVRGLEVPQGATEYAAVFSTRPPAGGGSVLPLILIGTALIGGLVIGLILYGQRRTPGAPRAGVRILRQPGGWARFRRGVLTIGRDRHCELAVADPQVSRRHARIVQTPRGYVVEDLGSRNGTLVNGKKVTRQVLHHGDKIQVGDTHLQFLQREGSQR